MRLRHVLFATLLPVASWVLPRPGRESGRFATPGTDLVDVAYDLEGGGFGAVRIRLEVSSNGGASYSIPVTAVSGDVGEGILPGTGKSIVWNAGVDWDGNLATQMRLRVSAETGLVEIPGGTFTMGRTSGDTDSDAPPVAVTLATFHLAETETTKALWDSVRVWGLANGYTTSRGRRQGGGPSRAFRFLDRRREMVCNARSEREGLTPCYTVSGSVFRTGTATPDVDWSADGYRLPTEAEWEKAARGGVFGKRFPSGGDTISHAVANYRNDGGESYQTGSTAIIPTGIREVFPTQSGENVFREWLRSLRNGGRGLRMVLGLV